MPVDPTEKRIKVPVTDTAGYIGILNGIFGLTEREIMVLAEFVDIDRQLSGSSIPISPFKPEFKKRVAEKLGIEDFGNLNVYVQRLLKKKAIVQKNGQYFVNPLLKRGQETRIVFVLSGGK